MYWEFVRYSMRLCALSNSQTIEHITNPKSCFASFCLGKDVYVHCLLRKTFGLQVRKIKQFRTLAARSSCCHKTFCQGHNKVLIMSCKNLQL